MFGILLETLNTPRDKHLLKKLPEDPKDILMPRVSGSSRDIIMLQMSETLRILHFIFFFPRGHGNDQSDWFLACMCLKQRGPPSHATYLICFVEHVRHLCANSSDCSDSGRVQGGSI